MDLSGCIQLRVLRIQGVDIKYIPVLDQCRYLEVVDIRVNGYIERTDNKPRYSLSPLDKEDWSALTNLHTLTLLDSDMKGTIPTWIGKLTGLMRLSLSGNKLSGSIPSTINLRTETR